MVIGSRYLGSMAGRGLLEKHGANHTFYNNYQDFFSLFFSPRDTYTCLIRIITQKTLFHRNNNTVIKLESNHRKGALFFPHPHSLIPLKILIFLRTGQSSSKPFVCIFFLFVFALRLLAVYLRAVPSCGSRHYCKTDAVGSEKPSCAIIH